MLVLALPCWRSPAIGQTLVVIIGGIDLSIPFVIGFANVVAAQLYGDGMNFVAGLRDRGGDRALTSAALNGALSAGLGIHPLIVTLGIGTVVQGAVLLWTKGFPSGSAPQAVSDFVSIGGTAGPLPVPWLVPAFGRAGRRIDPGAGPHALWTAALRARQQSARRAAGADRSRSACGR